MGGYIYQINVKPEIAGKRGLPKLPVESALVTFKGVGNDFNTFRYKQEKDDPADRAVLLLPLETITELNNKGWPVKPGHIGENITTKGILYAQFMPGKCYKIGEIKIKIHDQATPCGALKRLEYITEKNYQEFKQILEGRRGWYARVLQEGTIKKGDSIEEL